jgi:hypothetical protein
MSEIKTAKIEEVGDLFVTPHALTIKLLPSKKSASHPIHWFSTGKVVNAKAAARDIAYLIGRVQGKSRVVRGLTVMTDAGTSVDLDKTGLSRAVKQAGFTVLR